MRLRSSHRRLAGWIAIAALLLAALAPTLSHALNAGQAAPWLAVCTAQGLQGALPSGDDTEQLPGSAASLAHCPWCNLHAAGPGLPPAAAAPALADGLAHALPQAFLAAPCTLHAWTCAQARAPPAIA